MLERSTRSRVARYHASRHRSYLVVYVIRRRACERRRRLRFARYDSVAERSFGFAAYVIARLLFRNHDSRTSSICGMLELGVIVVIMLSLAYGKHDTSMKVGNVVLAMKKRVT